MSNDTQPEIRFPGFTDDWEQRKFGVTNSYFTDGNYGESYPSADELSDKLNGVPFLRGSNLKNGRLVEEDANYITPEKHAELTSGHLELDDIVVAVRGSLGALGYAGQENVGWNINSQLAIIRTDKSELKGQFLIQYLLSSKGQKELLSRNTGTALKQLPIKQLKDVPVPIPGIDEQDRIGSFFVNLDTTIALHQRKLDLLKETKKGFLQKMFPKNGAKVPEIRFPGFTDDWEQRTLGDILKEFSIKSKVENEYTVLSSTNSGMEIRNGRVSGVSNLGYKIIENGDLVLSPQNLWLGNININNVGTGLVSPSYKTFKFIKVDPGFIRPQLRTARMLEEYKNSSTQGASVVRRNLELGSFYQITIKIPSDVEQGKIGLFFKQLDNLIALHQRKLDLLKETKKGFLQKMFV
ncbi:restriction endonuclease subunit S [Enterococcus faecium]|uniref:restriction endonuclease subunit S n=2 Tax=Enterococcus TaxID=1350 RepID=UPI0010BF89EC|nr:restriction endonuclease subunit S [Enterococcus faecium]TKN81825.1 restriction endonuclease subunit S [Enterococcus faecium]TKN81857.1 restriction endonuclease subunit S [Enterococcus faecium]TKO41250.1 restriction endonuclease subunit S [Enterococcus faecium]